MNTQAHQFAPIRISRSPFARAAQRVALLGAVLLAPLSTSAMASTAMVNAGGDYSAVSKRVNFADLNLATDEGVRALHRRLSHAARQVCGPQGPQALRDMVRAAECRSQAIRRAVDEVGNPRLAQLAADRGYRG